MPIPVSEIRRGVVIRYNSKVYRIAQVNLLYRGTVLTNGDVYPERPELPLKHVRAWNLWEVAQKGSLVTGMPRSAHNAILRRKRKLAKREIWRETIQSRRLSRKRGSDGL